MARGKRKHKRDSVIGVTAKPVTLDDALERLLPCCDNNPRKVASRLNRQHQDDDVYLLAEGFKVPSSANPTMLAIVAHSWPDGRAFLYVQVREAGGRPAIWDGQTPRDDQTPESLKESLARHHQYWTFERKSFEDHFPASPKNRGGRPPEFNVEDLKDEALVYVGVAGALPKTMEGEGGLYEQLKLRLGSRCPERTRFYEIFGPIFQRIRNERPR